MPHLISLVASKMKGVNFGPQEWDMQWPLVPHRRHLKATTQRGGQCIGFKALELVLKEVGIKGALRPVSLRETAAPVLPRA